METFLKTYKKLPTNGNTDIKNLKKLRFIDRKNPKALINSLEHLLPMTKASWTREKIEKSGYSLVYLKDLVE